MSKEFGLDWKKHGSKRMQEMYQIMGLIEERTEKEQKKHQAKLNSKKYGRR